MPVFPHLIKTQMSYLKIKAAVVLYFCEKTKTRNVLICPSAVYDLAHSFLCISLKK